LSQKSHKVKIKRIKRNKNKKEINDELKIKLNVKVNLDQLKTLILTKGGQKRVGSFLPPPSLSHNRISHVSSTSVLGAAHYLLTYR
jgi:hypothetical protein